MSRSFDRLIEPYRGSYGEPALPAGAAAEDIDRVEAETGLQVPRELREILLRHDGTSLVPLLPDGAWFDSAEQMVEAWQAFGELADTENEELPPEPVETGAHSNAVHHRRRLPFATREDFELFIDYEPGPKGTPGRYSCSATSAISRSCARASRISSNDGSRGSRRTRFGARTLITGGPSAEAIGARRSSTSRLSHPLQPAEIPRSASLPRDPGHDIQELRPEARRGRQYGFVNDALALDVLRLRALAAGRARRRYARQP